MSLLSVSGLTVKYGASQALFGVDLAVERGEVVALMGRNGMGKSTTIKAICRMVTIQSGEITVLNQRISQMPSHRVARLGVGLVPEGRRCFGPLSVEENLLAAARKGAWDFDRVVALFPRLGERRGQLASSLSGGEQQMVAIGRALMTNPELLILDEATEGLAPVVRQEIWRALHQLKSQSGLSILVVDKSLKELSQIADRAVVSERGKTVWAGRIDALTPDITDRYLGV